MLPPQLLLELLLLELLLPLLLLLPPAIPTTDLANELSLLAVLVLALGVIADSIAAPPPLCSN